MSANCVRVCNFPVSIGIPLAQHLFPIFFHLIFIVYLPLSVNSPLLSISNFSNVSYSSQTTSVCDSWVDEMAFYLIQLGTHSQLRGLRWASVVWQSFSWAFQSCPCRYPGILLADAAKPYSHQGAVFLSAWCAKCLSSFCVHSVSQVRIPQVPEKKARLVDTKLRPEGLHKDCSISKASYVCIFVTHIVKWYGE